MKLRRHRTHGEIAQATRQLLEVLDVVAVRAPSPDHRASRLVRVDLKVRLGPATPTATTGGSASPAGRPRR